MHILFLTDNFPPESNAPASRTFEHAREWVKAGHEVTVITCAPNFPQGEVYKGYANKFWQSEHMAGIRVVRVWSYITANEGFSRRILDYQSYMVSSFIASLFIRKVDVVVGTSPQFFTAVSAWAVAAIKRRPFVFELRDIWPESIRAVGAMENSRVLDLFEKLELFLYRRAAAVISVTKSFKLNLISRGIDGSKIHVVTNGVDAIRFSPMEKDRELLHELGLKDCFVAGYVGTHGMAHGLETLLLSAKILQNTPGMENFRLLLLGDGACRESLLKKSEELKIHNVIFLQSVAKEEVNRYWSLLDVSIIHLRRSDLFKTVIPSKMFECFGMGLPILLGVEGESAEILNEHNTGLTFEPDNVDDLVRNILDMKSNPELMTSFSTNGVGAARAFDRSRLANSMLKILQNVGY